MKNTGGCCVNQVTLGVINMHRGPMGLTVLTAASAALLSLALFAPGAAVAQKIVTVVLPEEPDSLDNCNSARSAVGRVIRQNINETLVQLDPNDSSLRPRLAISWQQVEPTVWRFKLRPGVKYSDGRPVTPEGISKSIAKALDPSLDCNARTKMFAGFAIKGVRVDAETLDIITPRPDPILPVRMTTITIGDPDEAIKILQTTVGTGPYVLDRYVQNSEITLKRNPNYWGKAPEADGAKYVWRKESAVAAAMVKVGEAHLATNIGKSDATDKATDFAYPNSETNYLRVESQVAPFDDKRVRLALQYGIDRKALHGTIIAPEAQMATQMVIPRIAGHNHEIDKKQFPYDPAKAKALLAEAKAAGTKVDTPIDFICRINQWENTTETCEAIHAMYKAVGFNMTLKMLEVSLWNDLNAHPSKGPNNAPDNTKVTNRAPMLLGHMHDNNVGDPVFSMYPKYHSKAQVSPHSNPQLDELIIKAEQTAVGPERTKLWEETMRIVYEDMAADVFLFHMVGFARVNPKIKYQPTAATNSEVLIEQIAFK